ncbi:MAG: peptide chain release factor N(5)-glutamine methyltransferase [Rubrivivax sp.]
MSQTRIADLLSEARTMGVARLDAQLLLAHHLQKSRAWLLAHDDQPVPAEPAAAVRDGLARRATGEPLSYIVGSTAFCGLTLKVSTSVLVPRPETEDLVAWALQGLRLGHVSGPVVDLGTGSGAIALAVLSGLATDTASGTRAATAAPAMQVSATDASADALAIAAVNAQHLGLPLELLLGDWWAPLTGRRFGMVISNPPYIAAADPHLAALAHEPIEALTSGADGLDALRTIIAGAPGHLLPGGWLLLEHGHDQGPAVQQLLRAAGFGGIETRNDLAGLARCSRGVQACARHTQNPATRA